MLAATGNPVAGSTMLSMFSYGTYPEVAALAVVTSAITAAVVIVALRLSSGSRSQRERPRDLPGVNG